MALIAVSIAVTDPEMVAESLHRAQIAALHDADVVEWRVEGLAGLQEAGAAVEELLKRSPMPCILTARSQSEGGETDADEETLAALIEAGGQSPPTYIDIELSTWQRGGPCVEAARELIARGSRLIISTHDHQGRPTDLARRIEAMSTIEAAAVTKVVWTARSVADLCEVADVLATRRRPTIALCMGEMGVASRIAAPVLGGFLTFATTGEGDGTAPGQQSIDALIDTYRFRSLRMSTKIYGIIGWPVAGSLSPVMHNAGFTATDEPGVYVPLPVRESYEHFKAAVSSLVDDERVPFFGGSVTMPHKAHLVQWVTEREGAVCALSSAIKAANTLVVDEDGGVSCFNSDGPAVVSMIRSHLDREDLTGLPVTIIGAGGMASASAGALAHRGAAVRVVNRTRRRAEQLAKRIKSSTGVTIEVDDLEHVWSGSPAVIVQATSVGMAGGPDPAGESLPPVPEGFGTPLLVETVSTPAATPLVKQVQALGWSIVGGEDVLLEQAMAQFQAWTGHPPPRESMREAMTFSSIE